jgi:ESCRT-I complex subunit VPS28
MYTANTPPVPRQQPYAPTPHSYTPSHALSARINLDTEVKLPTNLSSERDILDSLAEIYSIIVALDGLEKAFNKDSVTDAEYTELCGRLLKQYRGNLSDERVSEAFKSLEEFRAEWNVSITLFLFPSFYLIYLSLITSSLYLSFSFSFPGSLED